MISEEKLLVAKCSDLFRLCGRNAEAQFSSFLNEAQQALIKREVGAPVGYNCAFFGGYPDAGRKIFGVFPEWEDPCDDKFPIAVLKIVKTYDKELSHRDYLGTLLSGGLERSCIGDIIIDGDTAYAYVLSGIADYIAANTEKISNVGVKISRHEMSGISPPPPKFTIINAVAASLRLDAVVSAMLNISRKNSSMLISKGLVSVDHTVSENTSMILKGGETVSVRGYGRYEFLGALGETRSQRIHIEAKKYI